MLVQYLKYVSTFQWVFFLGLFELVGIWNGGATGGIQFYSETTSISELNGEVFRFAFVIRDGDLPILRKTTSTA